MTTVAESLETKLTELGVTNTNIIEQIDNPFHQPIAMAGRLYMGPRTRIRRSHGSSPQISTPVRKNCNQNVPNLLFQRVVMAPPILMPTDSSDTSDESS